MNRNLNILSVFALLVIILTACAPVTVAAPITTPTEYINVAGGHPKTLDFLITEGQNISDACPEWISQSGKDITFAPDLSIQEGDYDCGISDGTKKLIITVRQVEPIPHFDFSKSTTVTAGQQNWILVKTEIPLGNAHFEYSGLPDWMTCEEGPCRDGFISANPPVDAKGLTFVFTAEVTDYVWLSRTETITITVKVQ